MNGEKTARSRPITNHARAWVEAMARKSTAEVVAHE